ncbi:meiosis-specific with OB domain-containing protein [Adelges cooleyi]|uniref:meiosis-specific with OB domain-containing protein n=1 Tax=Adelges cooleyi TaxID=133065 RepID=UPI00217FF846|nr:meiosis-specific with OB domain-containing protein [Adelges cooleyi]XP_050438705.1 meiosis-specific with OB domain-containing protein [Adelges cooleyi]
MATGIMRLKINSISVGTTNFILIGIIIAKQNPRLVISKKDNTTWYVFTFTLRDSPEGFLNVTAWGSFEYINKINATFKIGDVVDIVNAKISFRKNEGAINQFTPSVTSCLGLTLYQNGSQISKHDQNDCKLYQYLLRLPTRSPNSCLVIADIHSHGKILCGKYCCLMVAVRQVNNAKCIKSKTGVECNLREITVMDKTHSSLILLIWNDELVKSASQWIPRETILFLADVRLDWSEFKENMIAIVTGKTIITENPCTKEAEALRNFSELCSIGPITTINTTFVVPDVETIVNIMSCKNIKKTCNIQGMQEFTALVYAVISKFDIDGLTSFVYTKCNLCGSRVNNDFKTCLNFECISNMPVGHGVEDLRCVLNIRMSLTDSSGTLENCQVSDHTATKLLGSVEDFLSMSSTQKTEIKWKYLFTNCAVKLVIPKYQPKKKLIISIVDIRNEGNIFQYISDMPLF